MLASYLTYAAYAFLVVTIIGGVAYASRLPQVTVTHVTIEGVVRADEVLVHERVMTALDGTYAFLIPKRMSYAVPRGALTASVMESFPTVASASVERTDRNTLVVRVVERVPHALWCLSAQAGGNGCYLMDSYGLIFDAALGGESLRVYRGQVADPIGAQYLAGAFQDFDALLTRIEVATSRHITEVTVDQHDDVFAHFAEGGEVRFVRTTNSEVLVATIKSIFDSTIFQNKKELDYVELRFGQKAVAKFKE